MPVWEGGKLIGYDFLLGGGHGMTHNNPRTYPRLASPVAFVEPGDLLEAAAAVVKLHRDWGDRGDRRHARLKYVIAEMGEEWARARLEEYLGKPLAPYRPLPPFLVPYHLGWHGQGDGRHYLGLPIASGRIVDGAVERTRTALRVVVARFACNPILMPSQDIILSEIRPEDREAITAILRAHRMRFAEDLLPVERWALACPALPSCGLALTEAERVRSDILADICRRLARYGLERERISVRVTGCPNGCARPYLGEIGLVGTGPGRYNLYLGGAFDGSRLSKLYADNLDHAGIIAKLDPLFAAYAAERDDGERFGGFVIRAGFVARTVNGADFHVDTGPRRAV